MTMGCINYIMLKPFKLFLECSNSDFVLLEMSSGELHRFEQELNATVSPFGLYAEVSQHVKNRLLPYNETGRRDSDAGATNAHSHFAAHGTTKQGYSDPRDVDVSAKDLSKVFKMLFYRYGRNIVEYKSGRREFVGTVMGPEGLNASFKIDYQNTNRDRNVFKIITVMKKKGFIPNKNDVVFRI